jgi:predicted thioesterase
MAIAVGLKGVFTRTVAPEDTAHAQGNPGVHVLSTPTLSLFCEMACHDAVVRHFAPDQSTVGIHNDFWHLAATPVGETVRIEAELVEIDRKRLKFTIAGWDERNQIVRGIHERFLVNLPEFIAKLPKPKG